MKYLYIIGTVLCLYGCQTPMEIFISPEELPIKIEKGGCFVDKTEYIKLVNGQSVKYNNDKIGKFYIPSNLIVINDGFVKLKSIEN